MHQFQRPYIIVMEALEQIAAGAMVQYSEGENQVIKADFEKNAIGISLRNAYKKGNLIPIQLISIQ